MKHVSYLLLFICFSIFALATSIIVKLPINKLDNNSPLVTFVSQFTEMLTNCSNSSNISDAVEKRKELFTIIDPYSRHVSDLFNNEDDEKFISYCSELSSSIYLNKINVHYNNIVPLNCNKINEGRSLAFVSVDKTLCYNGKTNKVTEIVAVDITDPNKYKIVEIKYLDNENICNVTMIKSQIESLYNQYKISGDLYYKKSDYISAKNRYNKALAYRINDSYINGQID